MADISIDRTLLRVALKLAAPGLTEVAYSLFAEWKLSCWEQMDLGNRFHRTLIFRVKKSQALNFIIEQIDTIRGLGTHREKIDNRSAECVFTMLNHLRDGVVTATLQS